ncbi:MAG: 3-acetyloctanal aminotransferase [Blastocatellia bacterium]|jgi:choline dehydrogenase-like flavoprotein|nr:3-acetyloctanal aminotransferase [Blastocatellia bacterium]
MIRQLTPEHRRHIVASRRLEADGEHRAILSATYDACVIGSGPGGAVAACTLAQAGLKVLLIERGPFVPPEQQNFRVLDMSNKYGHVETTSGYRTVLYQGSALGGSSLIFGAVAMKPQQFIFDEWQEKSGVTSINAETLEPHYKQVAEIMSVTRQSKELENRPNAIVREMASALGKPDDLVTVNRYTSGCAGVGLCNFGCGVDLKGNMINSFLPLALETGNLTVLTDCEAAAIVGEQNGKGWSASGVAVSMRDRDRGNTASRIVIRARKVIVAAGAFFSSGILLRSPGLPNRDGIGKKVYLQPHAQVFALFDEPVTKPGVIQQDGQYVPFNGVPAIYNFLGFLREHHFWWLASILYPAGLASFVSHLPPKEHFEIMRRYHHTMGITVTVKDDPAKSGIVLKDGRAQLDFRESGHDIESFRECFLRAAEAFLAVGARKVFLPLLRPPVIESIGDLKKIKSLDFSYNDLILYSDHTSGGNQFGADNRRGATDSAGRVFGTRNVYVADSSLFPAAPGVNPSWTIMALARHVATSILAEPAS